MSQLETAMAMLIKTFDTYAGKDGKKESLSKSEVKTMLEKELPGLLKVRCIPEGDLYAHPDTDVTLHLWVYKTICNGG